MSAEASDSEAESDRLQAWDAAYYQKHAVFVPALGLALVDDLAPKLGERILDLGCGTGELTAQIAARGAETLGVDASPDMVEAARAAFPGISSLAFEVANGEALSWTGQFDAIFSNAALHWMLRAEEVVRGMARALRPGGRLVAEFGGDGCVASVLAAVAEALRERGEDPSLWFRWYFPTPGQYATLLERHGFRVASVQLFARPTPMPGEDGLARWLRLFAGPLMTHLGPSAGAFGEDVAARCQGDLFRDGVWTLDYVRLRVRATRL